MAEATLAVDLSAPVRCLWPAEREATATKAITCLRRHGIATVGDLTASSVPDITDMRNAGPAVLAEVRATLAEHGLSLRGDNGVTQEEIEARARRLMRGGMRRAPALRFARQAWPEGEIAPGVRLTVTEAGHG